MADPARAGCAEWGCAAGWVLVALGLTTFCLWWSPGPRTCDDPSILAEAPKGAVWMGGSDGNYLSCRRSDQCDLQCAAVTYFGRRGEDICYTCEPEGGCGEIDLLDCHEYLSHEYGRTVVLTFRSGVRAVSAPGAAW